jgi:predicted Fe-Mo cluster-binding NifX family protein
MTRIGIPSLGSSESSAVADRFARAPWFLIADENGAIVEAVENTAGEEAHGAASKALMILSKKNVSVLLVPRLGPNALGFAKQAEMTAFCAEGLSVKQALEKYAGGALEKIL